MQQTEPESVTTSFGYDAAGRSTRYTNGKQLSTYYTYNSLGLPESIVEPSTSAHPSLADRTWKTSYDTGGLPVRSGCSRWGRPASGRSTCADS